MGERNFAFCWENMEGGMEGMEHSCEYSWPLNKISLNCTGPLTDFFQKKKKSTIAPHYLQLIESKDEELQLQRANCKVITRLGALKPVLFRVNCIDSAGRGIPQTSFLPCWVRDHTLQISLVGIHLPMQETCVWSLVWEDATCHGATNSPITTTEPVF